MAAPKPDVRPMMGEALVLNTLSIYLRLLVIEKRLLCRFWSL
jgi:hypothetical protein